MKNLLKKIFGRKTVAKKAITGDYEWYAWYCMDDGESGWIDNPYIIDMIEHKAWEKGCKDIYWSVNGGKGFYSSDAVREALG